MMVAPVIGAAGIGAAADLAGNAINYFGTQKANEFSWKKQKKVLQNQVQWRVEDAVKAGLHPLAALGVNPASGPTALAPNVDFSSLGQNLSRATEAMFTPEDKNAASMALLNLENASLSNDLLRAQIAESQRRLLNQPGSGPGVPGAGLSYKTPFGTTEISADAPPAYAAASKAYGDETAEAVVGVPWAIYDNLRKPGNVLDPKLGADVKRVGAALPDIYRSIARDIAVMYEQGVADLKRYYTPGGLNKPSRYYRNKYVD